jgi:hypothetical protein
MHDVWGEVAARKHLNHLGRGVKGREKQASLAASIPPLLPHHLPSNETEKLKFTPPPQPQQCMEFDKEATVPCSATGREKPTIKWVRAGEYHVSTGYGQAGQSTGQMCASLRACTEFPA